MAKSIVLEGIDGSGKSTQFKLAGEALEKAGYVTSSYKFPRYDTPSGQNITRYLKGDFGKNPADVSAYAASVMYSVDRYASFKSEWESFYRDTPNGVVLLDRYTGSNAIHQAAKLPPEARPAYYDWLYHFEYELLGLPKPDLVLVLDMPPAYAFQLTRARGEQDIHEKNTAYIESCYKSMLEAADYYSWQLIPCVEEGKIRPIEEIHRAVMEKIKISF